MFFFYLLVVTQKNNNNFLYKKKVEAEKFREFYRSFVYVHFLKRNNRKWLEVDHENEVLGTHFLDEKKLKFHIKI